MWVLLAMALALLMGIVSFVWSARPSVRERRRLTYGLKLADRVERARELGLDRQTSGSAVISLVSGILWGGGILSVVAIVAGHRALIMTNSGQRLGRGLAMAGTFLGYLGVAGTILLLVVVNN